MPPQKVVIIERENMKTTLYTALAAAALVSSPAIAEELRIGLASEATSIDPHFHNLTPNNQIGHQIFGALIVQGPKQELNPGLAVSWKPVDDLTWEFKLREGVKFHDGSDFNADDVICSFERAPAVPNSPGSFGLYTRGKTAVKVDDFTVHIKTETPYPLMPNDVSTINILSDMAVCNASTDESNKAMPAIGTGPYTFVVPLPPEPLVHVCNVDLSG